MPRFVDQHANQIRIGIRLKQHRLDVSFGGLSRGMQSRTVSPCGTAFSIELASLLCARIGDLNAAAKLRQISFASEQREGRPPVRAFLHFCAARSAVSRHVEPDVRAIDQEQLFFRGFIFPAHAAGTRKYTVPDSADAPPLPSV